MNRALPICLVYAFRRDYGKAELFARMKRRMYEKRVLLMSL